MDKSVGRRDFGVGFYTTTNAAQAESWAKSKKIRNHSEVAYVYVYEAIQNEESLMWSESAEYLVDEYYRRQEMDQL